MTESDPSQGLRVRPPSSAHRWWLVATAGLIGFISLTLGLAGGESVGFSFDSEFYWAPFCAPTALIPGRLLTGIPFGVVPGCFAVYLMVTGVFAWIWKRPLGIYLYTATTVPAVLLGSVWMYGRLMGLR